jgi:hypothetical protein
MGSPSPLPQQSTIPSTSHVAPAESLPLKSLPETTVESTTMPLQITPAAPQALYLFAGVKRKCDMPWYLRKLGWKVEEFDILRHRSHDLTKKKLQHQLLTQLRSGHFQLLIASPPCDTFTRVKFTGIGPKPCRSFIHPRGFPGLRFAHKQQVELGNILADFTCEAMLAIQQSWPAFIVAEFPEDLGAIPRGQWQGVRPASFWQWPQLQQILSHPAIQTVGIRQYDFGTSYVKPTRLIVPNALQDDRFFPGLPVFDNDGYYKGPIAMMKGDTTLIRKKGDKGFATTGTACWPDDLCKMLAHKLNACYLALPPPPSSDASMELMATTLEKGPLAVSSPSETLAVSSPSETIQDNALTSTSRSDVENSIMQHLDVILEDSMPAPLEADSAPTTPKKLLTSEAAEGGLTPSPPSFARKEAAEHNFWVGGTGSTRTTTSCGKTRPFHDGAGLTSPGRWPHEQRVFPEGTMWDELRAEIKSTIGSMVDVRGNHLHGTALQRLLLRLACGTTEAPVLQDQIAKLTACLHRWLVKYDRDYLDEAPMIVDGQPFFLAIIGSLLKLMKDPDHEVFKQFAVGVPLGVNVEMPRTPAIFEEQTKWRLDFSVWDQPEVEAKNYPSLKEYAKTVLEQFRAEEREGMMKAYRRETFFAEYGERAAISALAVLQERDKIRVLHDGTHRTMANNRIKIRDQLRMPTIREKRTLLQEKKRKGNISMALLCDVSKAHRRVKIRREDWGFQACSLVYENCKDDDEGEFLLDTVWVNTVGTFGMSSAAYWWGRLLGALIRCIYGLLGKEYPLDILAYADDIEMLGDNETQRTAMIMATLLLLAFGTPLKWSKFRGGWDVEWVGFRTVYSKFAVGITEKRAAWLLQWMETLLKNGKVRIADFLGAFGRVGFTINALDHCKPLLGPIYAWASVIVRQTRDWVDVPWAIRLIVSWLSEKIRLCNAIQPVLDTPVQLGELFRTDAKAENGKAYVGGWECLQGKPTAECRWFYLEIRECDFPWVFVKKDPQRFIAALELMGTILAVLLFSPAWPTNLTAWFSVTGSTDNQSMAYAVTKMLSTKWPITVLVLELAEVLQQRSLCLDLRWLRRDLNVEADAITNQDFSAFCPSLQIPVTAATIPWVRLPYLMEASQQLYNEITTAREENKKRKLDRDYVAPPRKRKFGQDKLKFADPWG